MNTLLKAERTHSVLALARGCNPAWLRRLRNALPELWALKVQSNDDPPRTADVDLVVIGADHPRPLWVARQLDHTDPRIHLVFIAAGDAAERLRRTLAFSALRAGFTVLDTEAEPGEWQEALTAAACEARQVRRMRGTLDQVNELIQGSRAPASNAPERSAMSESYLASLLTHLPKAVFSTDLAGRVVSWNPAAERLFGRRLGDTAELGFEDLFRVADRGRVARLWHAARAARGTAHLELSIDPPEGLRSDLLLLFAPIRHDGDIAGVLGFAEDITARLESQRERRHALQAEQRARGKLQKAMVSLAQRERVSRFLSEATAVLASSLDYESTLARVAELAVPEFADWCAVDIADEDGRLHRLATARSSRAAGVPDGLAALGPESVGASGGPTTVMHTGKPQLVARITHAMLRAVAADEAEFESLRTFAPRSYMSLPLSARGQTLGTVTLVIAQPGRRYGPEELEIGSELASRAGLAVDNARLYHRAQHELAEREQAQHQLAVRARQQAAVAQLGHTALVRGDLSALLEAAVHQVAETLEVELSDIQELMPDWARLRLRAGHGWPAELIGGITMASTETFGGRALATNGPVIMTDLDALPSSPALTLLRGQGVVAGVSVVIPGEIRPYGVLGAFSRRPRGFSREDVNFLEAVASVIAAAIQRIDLEATLRRQADELALADRRKNEFLAMLAHELRNPLSAAHNAAELLDLRGEDPEVRSMGVGVLGRQIRQLSRMVDDLLDVARITSGRIRLQRSRVRLADVVDQAVQTAAPQMQASEQHLSVDIPREPVDLYADPVRLAQVLTNLLSNSARYSEPGGRIELRARTEGSEAVLSVRDEGCGIAPELLPHVFDLFVQSDESLDRAKGGLGLGLTLVRQLTEMHGGSVEARSAGIGRGAEFIVRLPLPEDQRQTAPPPDAQAVPARRVLVVEDNPDVGRMLVKLLEGLGHEVRLAPDGESALEHARAFEPQVAFLDVGLPDMDGYEVARRLRREHRGRRMVVATLSGYGPPDRKEIPGVDCHLLKPARLDELNAVLARF